MAAQWRFAEADCGAYVVVMSSSSMPVDGLHFDAVLRPHRSLGPRGFRVLFMFAGGLALVAGGVFALHGAWPISGFFGLDVLALYLAFRASYRAAGHEWETIQLGPDALLVRRHYRGAAREWRLQPYWLSVDTVVDDERVVRLSLRSHGRELVVGRFLSPVERRDLADALRAALARQRAPTAT